MNLPIGAFLNSFKLETEAGVKKAAEIGAKGLQVFAADEMDPTNFSPTQRKEFLKYVKDNGLVITAVCCDQGHGGLGIKENNAKKVEWTKRVVDLAKDLESDIITGHISVIPEDPTHDRYKVIQEAYYDISNYAGEVGSYYAVETGPETAIVLKDFLDSVGTKGAAVNMDPANLVMVTGDDPVKAVYTFDKYIVHTHAKDGIKLLDKDPEIIYGLLDAADEREAFKEVPLGEGSVDFPKFLKALEDIGYNGFLTIEREVGANPIEDIKHAINFLKETMIKL